MKPVNAALERIRKQHQQASDRAAAHSRHQEAMLQSIETKETIVNSIKSLVSYLEDRTGRVAVINQLKEVGTPDALKVVDALNELHATLKTHQNTDLSEVTQIMRDVLAEAQQIPKDHPAIDIPSEVSVSNLPDHSGDFKQLLAAVQAIKLVAEAPVVNLPAPEVHVAPTDLKPIDKGLRDVEKAVRSIVIPEYKMDNAGVEKLLKQANKTLAALLDKPVGGGGGGGGRATPYEVSGTPAFVQLAPDGAVPVRPTSGLIPYAYDYQAFSNPDAHGNYQTITFKQGGSGGTPVAVLAFTFDSSSNVTSISRS